MNFTYNNAIYTGTREEIIESLKNDLEKISVVLMYCPDGPCTPKIVNIFHLGEEDREVCNYGNFNVNAIKEKMIQKALAKVPENLFDYNGKTYYGSKEQILRDIEMILRNHFSIIGNTYYVGESTYTHTSNCPLNLISLHEELIAKEIKRLEKEILC